MRHAADCFGRSGTQAIARPTFASCHRAGWRRPALRTLNSAANVRECGDELNMIG